MIKPKVSTSRDFAFRALDASGLAVTGKVTGDWTKRIRKEGGAWGAMTVTITEGENGWYHGVLSSSHTDTVGILLCNFSATSVVAGGALIFEIVANLDSDVITALAAVTEITSGLATASGVTAATSTLATAAAVAAIPAGVLAAVTEGSRTVRGVLRRLDALLTGKATGMIDTLFALYAADGTTKLVEATQDPDAGTRETASTVAGE